jgi:hypothetical protein
MKGNGSWQTEIPSCLLAMSLDLIKNSQVPAALSSSARLSVSDVIEYD